MKVTNRTIAAYLMEKAATRPDRIDPDAEDTETITFTVPQTGLRITCGDSRQALEAVAAKYQKGLRHATQTYKATVRQRDLRTVLREFIADGEWDNAREYLRIRPIPDSLQNDPDVLAVLNHGQEAAA